MKFRLHSFYLAVTLVLSLSACGTDISGESGETPSAGRADFSTFVAIGDSLTAGYADGALYRDAQLNSFPKIMARQFRQVGGGAFTQPLMLPEKTGSLFFGVIDLMRSDRLVLVATGDPDSPAAPVEITPSISSDISTETIPGLYNNIGVPGAKVFHGPAANYGDPAGLGSTANPYFIRFASSTTTSMLADAMAQAPSFFSLWLGNNDILLYALDGADATVNGESVTAIGTMTASFDALLAGLKNVNNQGLIINVPDISTIPYFTRVPFNAIPLTAQDVADLAPLVAGYNMVVDGALGAGSAEAAQRRLSFKVGQNPVLINDETLTDLTAQLTPFGLEDLAIARPATAKDYIVLPASRKIGVDSGGLYGISVPLVDADVLTETEFSVEIEPVRTAFNAHVEAAAAADAGLVFFDADAKLTELNETGIIYGSGGVSSTFGQGGAYSLDGIHPTARGNAVIANEIFKVINAGFDAYIPPVDPSDYTTVFYQ